MYYGGFLVIRQQFSTDGFLLILRWFSAGFLVLTWYF